MQVALEMGLLDQHPEVRLQGQKNHLHDLGCDVFIPEVSRSSSLTFTSMDQGLNVGHVFLSDLVRLYVQ